jgi:hypothetical protein
VTGDGGQKDKGSFDLVDAGSSTNISVTPEEERPPLFVFLAQNSKYLAVYPDDTTSPQYEACMWLNDTLLGNETALDFPFGEEQLLQVFALATLYYATNEDPSFRFLRGVVRHAFWLWYLFGSNAVFSFVLVVPSQTIHGFVYRR